MYSLFTFGQSIPDHHGALQEIDNLDSIIIDFAKGSLNNKILSVPLYIKTDDDINALDFSFRLNESNISIDTIIKNGTFEMAYFFNPNDRKMRLTSYSINDYNTDKKILTLYFELLGTSISNNDVFELSGFLNGDACPIRLTTGKFSTTSVSTDLAVPNILIYPNPAAHTLKIDGAEGWSLSCINLAGFSFFENRKMGAEEYLEIAHLNAGIYILNFKSRTGEKLLKTFIKN